VPTVSEHNALIARAKEGDVRAFEALIEEHVPLVRRFARSMCKRPAEADDLAQDALLKAYQSIRGYRFHSSFSSWLFRIVRNAFIDATRSAHARRGRLQEPIDPDNEPPGPDAADPERVASQREVSALLWDALRQLPVEYRTAVLLFDVEGFSQEEVAAIEGVAVGTVKSRLSRGHARLQRALVERESEAPSGNEDGAPLVSPRESTS
jgi:RNA polymerase sigma-70 factor (ECF subfamily)